MTMLTMALCTLWWSNYWASSAFIIAMFVIAAVNGANYYFDVRVDFYGCQSPYYK